MHDGDDEEANEVVSSWGFESESELRTGLRWHDEVGTGLGGLDLEAASKLSGSRFSVLRGSLARLERALSDAVNAAALEQVEGRRLLEFIGTRLCDEAPV